MTTLLLLGGLSAATCGGGFLRGYTGFGGALVMAPFFTRLLGPIESVAIISVLHSITALQGVRPSLTIYNRPVILPMVCSAIVSLPIGVYLLGALEPSTAKKAIAVIVIVFAILLSTGFSRVGRPTLAKSIAAGGLAGILNGFSGIGGPPAVLYLLSSQDSSHRLRAGFILFFAVLFPITVVALLFGGAVTYTSLAYAVALTPINYLATEAGRICFHRMHSRYFTPVCTTALCLLGLSMLFD